MQGGASHFATSIDRYSGSRLDFDRPRTGDDVAAYFHTGGTTGAPKLAAHTHRNQIVGIVRGGVDASIREHGCSRPGLPLFHVAGTIVFGLAFFMAGGRILLLSPAGFREIPA